MSTSAGEPVGASAGGPVGESGEPVRESGGVPEREPLGGHRPRHVPRSRAAVLCAQVLVSQIVTRGRLITLGLLGAAVVAVGAAVGVSQEDFDFVYSRVRDGAEFADALGLVLIVPIVSLVFASATLGDAREDGTLVYLWLRPMDRMSVAFGAVGAAIMVALPLTVVPVAVGGWLATGRSPGSARLAIAILVATVFGTVAYASLFTLLGLVLKRSVMWGICYVLFWEGIAVQLGDIPARLSLRGYTQSLLLHVASPSVSLGAPLADSAAHSLTTSVIVLLAATMIFNALSALRLNRMDIA